MDKTQHDEAAPGGAGNLPTQVIVPPPDQPSDPAGPTPVEAPEVTRARPSGRRRRRALWFILVPLMVLVAFIAAWAIDTTTSSEQVARNTELAGTPIGGMSGPELNKAVDALAAELPDTKVAIDAGDITVNSTAGALGLGIDPTATRNAAMDAGRDGNLLLRPFEWAGSMLNPRAVDVVLTVDSDKLDKSLTDLEGDKRKAPVEPTIAVKDSKASLVTGKDGVELTADDVVGAFPTELGNVRGNIQLHVKRSVVHPTMSDDQIQPLVDQANSIADRSIKVSAGDQSFILDGASLLDGVSVKAGSQPPKLTISEKVIGQQVVSKQLANSNPTGVTFAMGPNGPAPVAGHDVNVCCGEGATAAIVEGLLTGKTEVSVPTRTMTAKEGLDWAAGLGVNTVVGEFTTPHQCCQGRVTNIHRMADTLRGTLIPPGATFSVNETVGRRTADKGYVSAPVIIDGEHADDVGGGVSQFATTLFNAAFFAGLDIPQYQMHSEWISRYPYGREATLFYPNVDLKIHNNTPYGVVIWPTYTGTSLTVKLYSTRFAAGAQTAQSRSSGCGSVTTTRTRLFVDGTSKTDKFRGNYRCG